jgi:hypothetical protein
MKKNKRTTHIKKRVLLHIVTRRTRQSDKKKKAQNTHKKRVVGKRNELEFTFDFVVW